MKWMLLIFSVCVAEMCLAKPFVTLQQAVEIQENKLRRSPHNINALVALVDSYNLNSQYVSSENVIRNFEKSVNTKSLTTLGLLYLAYAKTYKYEDKNDKAIYYFLKAEDTFLKAKNFKALVTCGVEIIEYNRRLANQAEAEKQYYRFAFLAKQQHITNPKIWNGLYNRFAAVLNETSRPSASIRFSKKALKFAERINDLNAIAISYNEIGFSYKNMGEIDKAIEAYRNAENAWMEMGYYRDAVHAKMNLITAMTHNGLMSHDETINAYSNLLHFIDSLHIDYQVSPIYKEIASAWYFKGEFKKSIFVLNDFHGKVLDELDHKRTSEINNIEEKYQNDQLARENEKVIGRARERQRELVVANDRIIFVAIALIVVVAALLGLFYLWRKLKIANRLLMKRNEQKTVLVQEIHHRVKNNLQFVRSILEMQTGLNGSENDSGNLDDVSRRIDAMSLVHEMLYIEEEAMGVSVKNYLERLVNLSQTMFDKKTQMHIHFDVENIEIPIDKVVSIGIICSELIANSVKHAYNQNEQPKLNILLKSTGSDYLFEVSDNGAENDQENKSERFSLGMRLIDIFSRQLNGTYQISRLNGYKYSLHFQL